MAILFIAYFTEYGAPKTGLSPTIDVWDVSDGSQDVTAQAMTEVAGGFYKYNFAAADNSKDYVGRADGGVGQPAGERYVPCPSELVGGAQDILADTNELQGDWVNGGRLDLILDELTTQGDTNETKIDALENISVADILDGAIEGAITLKHAIAVVLAFCAGKCEGGRTGEITFRNQADDTNRLTLEVNANGDRLSTTIDISDL